MDRHLTSTPFAAVFAALAERLNSFSNVDFSGADPRESVYQACSFNRKRHGY
jgi:hypothetical protein